MIKTFFTIFIVSLFFMGCSSKQPIKTQSSTIIFKTPSMKFYDKGFIKKYDDHIHLEIFSVGQLVLDLKIYEDEVCRSTLECMDAKQFNGTYLSPLYKDDFLYKLFSKDKISFRDKPNGVLIKVR